MSGWEMKTIQNNKFQIGLVGGAFMGSILASLLAVSSINTNPSKGYIHGMAIVFACVIFSKILKNTASTAMSERRIFIIIWLLVHLIGLASFFMVRPTGLDKDPQFWLYFQSVFGAIAGISVVIIIRWIQNKQKLPVP